MMRRKDREITDKQAIYDIIKKCDVCRVAFFDQTFPYIIPLNFGATFENDVFTFYFHGANIGKKIELLQKNNAVAFELDCSHQLIEGETSCDFSMAYESVCGNGFLEMLKEEQKEQALSVIMRHYTDKPVSFQPEMIKLTTVLQLTVNEITAKSRK